MYYVFVTPCADTGTSYLLCPSGKRVTQKYTPLRALTDGTLTLEGVKTDFELWRQTKTTHRIPEHPWDKVFFLLKDLGMVNCWCMDLFLRFVNHPLAGSLRTGLDAYPIMPVLWSRFGL